MLPMAVKFIIGLIMAVTSFYIIGNLTNIKTKIYKLQNIFLIMMIAIPTLILYKTEFNTINTILSFIISIISFKKIFSLDIPTSIISTSIVMIITAFVEIILIPIEFSFLNYDEVRNIWYISIMNNVLISFFSILISKSKFLNKKFHSFCTKINKSKFLSVTIFAIVNVIIIVFLFYNLAVKLNYNITSSITLISILIFMILYYMYMEECNNYNKLKDEYDNIFNCIQTFEDWIDDEQMYRHELKNNLSIIRSLTENTKIIKKIDEMLKYSIIIDEQEIEDLKNIPRGGLKGLIYYKLALAKNKQVKLIIEVSEHATERLKKIDMQKMRELCIILGIYLDNSLEAAEMSDEKKMTLEIYKQNNNIAFVISNNYKKIISIKKMNKQGYTTKGSSHGNGLYYANKILKKAPWLKVEQIFLNNYFVQKILIK